MEKLSQSANSAMVDYLVAQSRAEELNTKAQEAIGLADQRYDAFKSELLKDLNREIAEGIAKGLSDHNKSIAQLQSELAGSEEETRIVKEASVYKGNILASLKEIFKELPIPHTSFESKVRVIKMVRELTGCRLFEAKELVEKK